MPIDIHYETSTTLDWSEVVTCPHCGLKCRAGLAVTGTGTGKATWGIGQDAARERAGVGAFTDAVGTGRTLIRRARCPQCRKRPDSAAVLAVKVFAFWAVALGVTLKLLMPADPNITTSSKVGCVAFFCLLLVPLTVWRMLASADSRVRFEELIEADQKFTKTPYVPLHLQPTVDESVAPVEAAPPSSGANDHGAWEEQFSGSDRSEVAAPTDDDSPLELDTDRNWRKKPGV